MRPTLADLVRLNLRRFPGRTAVVDDHGRLTHRELSERAFALARGLRAEGIGPGDRVAVLSQNSTFAIETFLGILCAGAVYVPANWRWSAAELATNLRMTAPSLLLVETELAQDYERAREGDLDTSMPAVVQGPRYDELLLPGGPFAVEVTPADPACILFTGGTTGASKGVVLSHRAVIANAVNERVDLGFGSPPDQVGLCVVPLFHSAALLCIFGPHYLSGGTAVAMRRFDEEAFADVVARERVTSTFIIPNMIRRLLAAGVMTPDRMPSLRQLHSGGGLLRMPDKVAVREQMPRLEMHFRYGLTEAGPMVTRLMDHDIMRPELDGSIGSEYTFAEVQLQDEDGREVPDGELGELCMRGPTMMTEYFRRPEETQQSLRGGWLHTGDLAVRGIEGNIFFRDRAKDMIKSGGENVYAAEIEQLLYAHPAVMECGVLGVPSEQWGEEVRAVVALRPGRQLTESELGDYLRERLAGYKIPKRVLFVAPERMPVNPSGKVVKARLREVAGW